MTDSTWKILKLDRKTPGFFLQRVGTLYMPMFGVDSYRLFPFSVQTHRQTDTPTDHHYPLIAYHQHG